MLLKEEIGRNWHTLDNDPIPHDWPENIDVQTYANDEGKWSVKVKCKDQPELDQPLKKFETEEDATFYANQQVDIIKRKTMNETKLRLFVRQILIEHLY